jgi:hypothetical protein
VPRRRSVGVDLTQAAAGVAPDAAWPRGPAAGRRPRQDLHPGHQARGRYGCSVSERAKRAGILHPGHQARGRYRCDQRGAEQLDVVRLIDEACGAAGLAKGPSVGELTLGVALQRACAPGTKRDLAAFLDPSVARISCLPIESFTGQAFHRGAASVTAEQLERAQLAIARAAVTRFKRFKLSTEVLAFDSTNFDTDIATTTPGELARRGHPKSKRSDLRVVGLGVLVSEVGHVPLLHRTDPGNSSDQAVLASCLQGLAQLHDELDAAEGG